MAQSGTKLNKTQNPSNVHPFCNKCNVVAQSVPKLCNTYQILTVICNKICNTEVTELVSQLTNSSIYSVTYQGVALRGKLVSILLVR